VGEFFQIGVVRAAVIDRPQPAPPEQLGQLVGIDLIALVPVPGRPPPIADDDPMDERRDQVVQPLRLGPFFERDVNRAAQTAEKLDDRGPVRLQDAPGQHPPALLPDRGHGRCLMHVERDILGGPCHESRSLLLGSMGLGRLHGSSKGRALNMR